MPPVINTGQEGGSLAYTEVFADEFSSDGPLLGPNWQLDDMGDGLHRAGNSGQDENGNTSSGSVPGKRWAAWYNHPNPETFIYRQGGQLHFGGAVINTPDPTRDSYIHDGTNMDWANNRLYTGFAVTQKRIYSNEAGGHIVDPTSPNITFTVGHFFEMRVSYEQMKSKGFRLSFWLMPAIPNESNAYDGDKENGVEIDIFEFENWVDSFNATNVIQQKVIGGALGTTTGGNVDASSLNLQTGFHTIGLLWRTDLLVWYINGVEVQRDTTRVPSAAHYMLITREINSGAKNSPNVGEIQAIPPKRPEDVGLYAVSAFESVADIPTDEGLIDYVRVWSVDGDDGGSTGGTGGTTGGTTTTTEARRTRDNFQVLGGDLVAETDLKTYQANVPEGGDPESFSYLWSATGDIQIVGPADQITVTIAGNVEGSGQLTCTINEL